MIHIHGHGLCFIKLSQLKVKRVNMNELLPGHVSDLKKN